MPEGFKRKFRQKANWDSPTARAKFIISQSWRFAMSLIVPLLYLPIFFWEPKDHPKAPHGAYTVLLVATYWILECIPLPITALLPVFLLPTFGISHSDTVCSSYFNDTIMFLFGGCIMALSFEYSNLHTRIAFFVMKLMGAQASVLLLGMMITCMILSCWMNNTSTTALMVPIVYVIMDQYQKIMIPQDDPHELAMEHRTAHELEQDDVNNVNVVETLKENDIQQDPVKTNEQHDMSSSNLPNAISEHSTNLAPHHDHDKQTPKVNFPDDTKFQDGNQVETPFNAAGSSRSRASGITIGTVNSAYWEDVLENKREFLRNLQIMFMIGIAFASNIGGTGVITGTGTNLIAISQLGLAKSEINSNKTHVKDMEQCTSSTNQYWDLDFTRWTTLNGAGMIVNVLLTWAFLSVYFQGFPGFIVMFWRRKILKKPMSPYQKNMMAERRQVYASIKAAIKVKYKELGPMKFQETLILILFVVLVTLWIFRSPLFMRGTPVKFNGSNYESYIKDFYKVHPACESKTSKSKFQSTWGWSRFFGDKCDDGYLKDTAATILICILLFTLPKEPIYYRNILRGGLAEGLKDPLLPFKFVNDNLPWGPFFLLGGGFGIALAIKDSELSNVLSDALASSPTLKDMSINALLGVTLAGVAFVTTLASNTATAAIVSPVLIELALNKGYPPLYLLVPPVVGASYAFCLPISTPPNAIVYDKANMKQLDMIIPGFFVTFICNAVLFLFTITYTKFILNVDSYDGSCDIVPNANGTGANAPSSFLIVQRSLSLGLD